MLPERTMPSEIYKLGFRATLIGILGATALRLVFGLPWLMSFTLVVTLVFLDGFVESSKWKERLIRGGIAICLIALLNITVWPIGKSIFASYFPIASATLARAKMGTEMWFAKKIDSPAVEAKSVLFRANEEYEKKDLSREVAKKIATGDSEGAAELIRAHQEKRAQIEASLNPESAGSKTSGPGLMDKAKKLFDWSGKSTTPGQTLRGQNVHLLLKPGEETGQFEIPLGILYDIYSNPGSNYKFVTPDGREYDKNAQNIGRFFKIRALSDCEIEMQKKQA